MKKRFKLQVTSTTSHCSYCRLIEYMGGRKVAIKYLLFLRKQANEIQRFMRFNTPAPDVMQKLYDDTKLYINNMRQYLYHSDAQHLELSFQDRGYIIVADTPYASVIYTSLQDGTPNRFRLNTDSKMEAYKLLKTRLREIVKKHRESLKTRNIEPRRISVGAKAYVVEKLGLDSIGFTYYKPETILNLMFSKKSESIFQHKKPTNNNRHVGIELEFFSKARDYELAADFARANLENYIQLKHDNSIEGRCGYYTQELCILAREDEYAEVVQKICKILAKHDAQVNKSCGLHVHIDMRSRDKDVVYSNLVTAQPLLYAMNPPSRADNRYCRKVIKKQFGHTSNRYHGINSEAFRQHETIEVRIHAGTVDAAKINNWIRLLLYIANKSNVVKRTPSTFSTFVKRFKIDFELCEYIVSRIEKFASPNLEEEAA